MGVNLPGECQVGMFCGCLYGEKKKPQAQTCGEEGVMGLVMELLPGEQVFQLGRIV